MEDTFRSILNNHVFPAIERGINVMVWKGTLQPRIIASETGAFQPLAAHLLGGSTNDWKNRGSGFLGLKAKVVGGGEMEFRFASLKLEYANPTGNYAQVTESMTNCPCSIPFPGASCQFSESDLPHVEAIRKLYGKNVRVVGLGRHRGASTGRSGSSGQKMTDPILLVIADEQGNILWMNPWVTLEVALTGEPLNASSIHQAPKTSAPAPLPQPMPVPPKVEAPIVPAPKPVPVPVAVPAATEAVKAAPSHGPDLEALRDKFVAEGEAKKLGPDLALKIAFARIAKETGIPLEEVKKLLAPKPDGQLYTKVKEAYQAYFDMLQDPEESILAAAADLALAEEDVRNILANPVAEAPQEAPTPAPAPAKPAGPRPRNEAKPVVVPAVPAAVPAAAAVPAPAPATLEAPAEAHQGHPGFGGPHKAAWLAKVAEWLATKQAGFEFTLKIISDSIGVPDEPLLRAAFRRTILDDLRTGPNAPLGQTGIGKASRYLIKGAP